MSQTLHVRLADEVFDALAARAAEQRRSRAGLAALILSAHFEEPPRSSMVVSDPTGLVSRTAPEPAVVVSDDPAVIGPNTASYALPPEPPAGVCGSFRVQPYSSRCGSCGQKQGVHPR